MLKRILLFLLAGMMPIANAQEVCYQYRVNNTGLGITTSWNSTVAAACSEYASDFVAAYPGGPNQYSYSLSGSVDGALCRAEGTATLGCIESDYPSGCGVPQEFATSHAWSQVEVECPDEECNPALDSGFTTASVSSPAVGTEFCGAPSHCVLRVTQGVTVVGDTQYQYVYENTGETCSDQDNAPSRTPDESCRTVGDFSVCVNPSGEGQCGYVNDQFVCLKNIKRGGCQVFGDSSRVCEASAGVPPVPDSGTAGQPATPDAVVSQQVGTSTNTYNYYSSSTVAGSSRDPGSDGTPQGDSPGSGGLGDGDDDEESQGSASGGEGCGSPPSCDGDPVGCSQLHQQWLQRCDGPSVADVGAELGDGPEVVQDDPIDMSTALSESDTLTPGSGVCPAPPVWEVFGASIPLPFITWMCAYANGISPFVMIAAYISAGFIVFGVGRPS